MSATSVVDDILMSISQLPLPRAAISSVPDTAAQSLTEDPLATSFSNHLLDLSPPATKDAQSLFLALHFLFPHELLPALDLLDRGLVTNLIPTIASSSENNIPHTALESNIYYIQSASAITDHHHTRSRPSDGEIQSPGRFRNPVAGRGKSKATQTYYEVRLDSWNCSCAAFAFSAFTDLMKDTMTSDRESGQRTEGEREGKQRNDAEVMRGGDEGRKWTFGGILTHTTAGVPVCKHILAALMVRAAPAMFDNAKSLEAEKEEMAGWGAGWGEAI